MALETSGTVVRPLLFLFSSLETVVRPFTLFFVLLAVALALCGRGSALQPCSGLRGFLALSMLCVLYACWAHCSMLCALGSGLRAVCFGVWVRPG